MAFVRGQARLGASADFVALQRTSRSLHTLATVRGAKTVLKFFPHEAADVEPCVALLIVRLSAHGPHYPPATPAPRSVPYLATWSA